MNDRSQTSRQLFILEQLNESRTGLTIQQIHKKVCYIHSDISERTIRRDIEQLSTEFEIEEGNIENLSKYKLNKYDLQSMSFTMKDLYALALTKVMLSDYIADEISLRVVEPYHFAVQEGNLHLVAFCRLRNELRDFRVSMF